MQNNNELTRTLTDGNVTSSLMKKAQENAASIQQLDGLDTKAMQQMLANHLYSQEELNRTAGNELLSHMDA